MTRTTLPVSLPVFSEEIDNSLVTVRLPKKRGRLRRKRAKRPRPISLHYIRRSDEELKREHPDLRFRRRRHNKPFKVRVVWRIKIKGEWLDFVKASLQYPVQLEIDDPSGMKLVLWSDEDKILIKLAFPGYFA